jgi:hypothetical protein
MANLDMTDGVYRRIYSGFLGNKKVNRLSWQAEAWFWRLVVLADDFGNLSLKWRVLAVDASPIREVSIADAQRLTAELVNARLAFVYRVDGDEYLHIIGFIDKQPAGKNGRRIQRIPMHPEESGGIQTSAGESGCIQGNPGESGGIQNNPGESSPSETTTETTNQTTTEVGKIQSNPQPAAAGGVVVGKADKKPPKLIPDFSPQFLAFWNAYPTVRRQDKQKCWKRWQADFLDREKASEVVTEGLRRWKNCHQWNKDGGQFVCNPYRWLMNRMYLENPPTAPIKEFE